TPVLDVDGGVTLILHALEDVTAVTRAQQALRAMERVVAETTAARNEAQRTSQLKTRFLGMISHGLRTPLTALCLQVERMQHNSARLDYRQHVSLERRALSAGRLREMIETLLEYARIEGGHVVINTARFDLCDSVQK